MYRMLRMTHLDCNSKMNLVIKAKATKSAICHFKTTKDSPELYSCLDY